MMKMPAMLAATLGGQEAADEIAAAVRGWSTKMLSVLSRIADDLDVIVEDIDERKNGESQ